MLKPQTGDFDIQLQVTQIIYPNAELSRKKEREREKKNQICIAKGTKVIFCQPL
jgi:hypothetical protein